MLRSLRRVAMLHALWLATTARGAAACRASSLPVRLLYARPLRPLLRTPRRSETITLERTAPLSLLHAALAQRLPQPLAASELFFSHGRRRIETDDDLHHVLSQAEAHGVDALLRVEPNEQLEAIARAARKEAEALAAAAAVQAAEEDAKELAAGPKQLLSFYTFCEIDDGRQPLLKLQLRQALSRVGARGSVYVAGEGINAQLALAVARVEELQREFANIPELADVSLNFGVQVDARERPYQRLIVREKDQILTDGLYTPLDWSKAGSELSPAEWHSALSSLPDNALVLDCRNDYESKLGSFRQAEPLGTASFSGSWDALRQRLADTPKNTPIYTFCTGGIRCVKVNAWLEAELGFKNTARLQDGIHGYMRYVEEEAERIGASPVELSYWQGANFIFYQGPPRELTGEEEEPEDQRESSTAD